MTEAREEIQVLVVDDHFFTRMGVTAALKLEQGIRVVAEASSGTEAIEKYAEHLPDVTVLDGKMPDLHGVKVAERICGAHPDPKLLLFSVDETEEDIHRAVAAGVRGYLPKSAPRTELVEAVRCVAAGGRYFPEAVKEKLRDRRSHSPLSKKETEVLRHMAEGLPNKLIAVEMGVSTETVKSHVAHLLRKLGAQDRTAAVLIAVQRGILEVAK